MVFVFSSSSSSEEDMTIGELAEDLSLAAPLPHLHQYKHHINTAIVLYALAGRTSYLTGLRLENTSSSVSSSEEITNTRGGPGDFSNTSGDDDAATLPPNSECTAAVEEVGLALITPAFPFVSGTAP